MEILQKATGNWIIEHDGLMVSGQTLDEAVIEYGEGMKRRGVEDQRMSNEINNASVY